MSDSPLDNIELDMNKTSKTDLLIQRYGTLDYRLKGTLWRECLFEKS